MQEGWESKDVRLTISKYPEVPKFEHQVTPKETAQGRYIFGGFGECSWRVFRGIPLNNPLAADSATYSSAGPITPVITPATAQDLSPPPVSQPPAVFANPGASITAVTTDTPTTPAV